MRVGKATGGTVTPTFITAVEAALQTARLAAVVESSVDAIVSISLDGRIESWNDGASNLFGFEADEVIGRSVLLIVPDELHAEEFRLLERIRRGERIAHYDTTRLTKDGRLVPVSLTLSPIRNATGAVVGASKISHDISERRRAEEMLAKEMHALAKLNDLSSRLWRTRALADGLSEMLTAVVELLCADKGNVQLLDTATQTLKIVAHSGFEKEFLEFFREVSAGDESACGRALRRGERTIIEDIERDDQYEPFRPVARAAGYCAVVATPLIGSDGTRLGAVSAHFSRVHRPTEQELRRLDLYLLQASDFIQRCQMEDNLRCSQEALLEADQRKDQFLALLAHELRNPLAAISYALDGAKSPAQSPAQRARADEVVARQVTNMGRLLDDLLDVSRMTMGKLDLKKEPTELSTTFDAALEAARPALASKGHALSLDTPREPVWLSADPMRLAQVFTNLLINAAKYTDPGGRIEITARVERDKVSVRVRDNGVGIPREVLPRLFAPFFQGDAIPWRAEGGLGVGLYLARGLVSLHGGTIEAFSEGANRGSEFVVQLPAGRPPAGHTMDRGSVAGGTAADADLRVLLVDDNRDAADMCATLLELQGQHVRTAYSGRSALELAESFRPQVVVLDIGLPDLDGCKVAQLMRGTTWGKDAMLIAVTGWGRDDDRERALAAGFDQHLIKPVTEEALQTLLHSVANRHRLPGQRGGS